MAVVVTEVEPNGNLVLNGHRQVAVDGNVWSWSLHGKVRRSDVRYNRTICSRDIFEMKVESTQPDDVDTELPSTHLSSN